MSNKVLPVSRDFETRILKAFLRTGRPMLVGQVTLEVGYSLDLVAHHLDLLSDRGAVRQITEHERKALGWHEKVAAFVLIDPTKFTVVPWSDYC